MPAGHLVADRDLPLHRDVHLDQLDDARRQFVAPPQAADFFVVERLQNLDLLLRPPLDSSNSFCSSGSLRMMCRTISSGSRFRISAVSLPFFFRITSPVSGSIRSRPTTLPSSSFRTFLFFLLR